MNVEPTNETLEEAHNSAQDDEARQSDQMECLLIPSPQRAPPLRRSKRVIRALERYMRLNEPYEPVSDEPSSYEDAMDRNDSKKWLEAMKSEMQSMYDNQVWNLVHSLERVKPIGNK